MKKQFLTLLAGSVLLAGCSHLCTDDPEMCPGKKADYTLDASLFAFDSAELSDKAKTNLNKAAQILKEDGKKAHVNGYTDNSGNAAYNLDLSQRRAKAVAGYLEKEGVCAKKLTVKGFGATDFVAPNDTKAGRAQNRRVDIVLQ
ncbi:MAG: OmpA family protein [Alphaproteobacteria bacterium]|nr:OmpA family protein [Alphaproteobacteria bacterium]